MINPIEQMHSLSSNLSPGFIRLYKVVVIAAVFFAASCGHVADKPKLVEVVKQPEDIDKVTNQNIGSILAFAIEHNGKMNDSVTLWNPALVAEYYKARSSARTWASQKDWLPLADSLYSFLRDSRNYGLFRDDYHWPMLEHTFLQLKTDSATKLDAALWSQADVLLTDAFHHVHKDLKLGRLERDSISTLRDSLITDSAYLGLLKTVLEQKSLVPQLTQLEPVLEGYQALKQAIPHFLDSMDKKRYTYIDYPIEIPEDSALYRKQLQARLFEGGYLSFNDRQADTAELAGAVRKYQTEKKLTVDGKAGPVVVKSLNDTDEERFLRIAINLDRYKLMADSLPRKYVWVNIPSFELKVWENDTMRFDSRVVVGQPATRTPVLTSELTNFVIFPQWTVPYSIIFKEMLPKIQKNVNYLAKQNLMVVDKNDSIIDPAAVNWFKFNKNNFPYLLKQREGDDNSLGVIKFNFRNKYSVYLHDTNARGYFSRSNRALSHGCVRVQQWNKLYKYLVKNDSVRYKPDTLTAWMKRKEKHTVNFSKRVPVFIRYFTCEGINGRVVFYDDIYADDKLARNRYFVTR